MLAKEKRGQNINENALSAKKESNKKKDFSQHSLVSAVQSLCDGWAPGALAGGDEPLDPEPNAVREAARPGAVPAAVRALRMPTTRKM